jgi:hypothetical protein
LYLRLSLKLSIIDIAVTPKVCLNVFFMVIRNNDAQDVNR